MIRFLMVFDETLKTPDVASPDMREWTPDMRGGGDISNQHLSSLVLPPPSPPPPPQWEYPPVEREKTRRKLVALPQIIRIRLCMSISWWSRSAGSNGANVFCFLSSLPLLPQPPRQCLALIHMIGEVSWEPKRRRAWASYLIPRWQVVMLAVGA
jgi:hypothetical protein